MLPCLIAQYMKLELEMFVKKTNVNLFFRGHLTKCLNTYDYQYNMKLIAQIINSMLFLCLVFTKSIFFFFSAFGKVDELFKLLNTKTGDLFEELSNDKISKFLARSSSTLFSNIASSFFCTTIEHICKITFTFFVLIVLFLYRYWYKYCWSRKTRWTRVRLNTD
jgi:hypothetical protein